MSTQHALPWIDDFYFQKTNSHIKNHFKFNDEMGIDSNNMDILLWRHWIVRHAINHAICFSKTNQYNFVECGVADGIATYFELRAIINNNIPKFFFHLYDSWDSMKEVNLSASEMILKGKYSSLEIDRTKNNLSEFNDFLIWHQGYVPDSFNFLPASPESILFLHVDLNSSKPTQNTLEYFFPRLVPGGIILFDDYGWEAFADTKKVIDDFLKDKSGILLSFPTGQAIYYNK